MATLPGTKIDILSGVPFDADYAHTIYFDSVGAQISYFSSKVSQQYVTTYQRTDRSIKVSGNADQYYNCNYIRWQNNAYGNKWFYAFITRVIYVNDNTTEFEWQMDYIQTYWFDFTFHEMYIEREHSETDFIGDNIVDEGLTVGEYVGSNYYDMNFNSLRIVVGIADKADSSLEGGYYDNTFSGLELYSYKDERDVINIINEYGYKANALVLMYMCPETLLPSREGRIPYGFTSSGASQRLEAPTAGEALDGYIPKNNKLYTYPYTFLHVSNNSGDGMNLRYEFFVDNQPLIQADGTIMSPVQVKAYPVNYKSNGKNREESVSLTNFPSCAWVSDYYQQWLAQNSVSNTLGAIGNIGTAVASAATGNLAGVGTGLNGILSQLTSAYTASIHADIMRGNTNSGNVNCAHGAHDFYTIRMTVNREYAEMIDNFFTRFGYKTMKLKRPNFNVRPSYNYVKTLDAIVTGTAITEAKEVMSAALNRGITFWQGDWVGDYSRDNSAGGTPPTPEEHTLNVVNGTGDGNYIVNTIVPIVADAAPEGQNFDHWSYDFGYVESSRNPSTNFIMPNRNATVTANYSETPPPTQSTLADEMEKDVGAIEWDSKVTAIEDWFYGTTGQRQPWCMMAVAYYAERLGILDQVSRVASTTLCYNYMNARGKLHMSPAHGGSYTPKRGDVVFISWTGNPDALDHTGIVSAYGDNLLYVSGNVTNPTSGKPDGIFIKGMTKTNANIIAYGEIDYT